MQERLVPFLSSSIGLDRLNPYNLWHMLDSSCFFCFSCFPSVSSSVFCRSFVRFGLFSIGVETFKSLQAMLHVAFEGFFACLVFLLLLPMFVALFSAF